MQDDKLREANVALATRLMNDFGRNMDGWYDHLHEDLVMELPFAGSIGLPTRLEGPAARQMFETAAGGFDVKFHDVVVTPMADPAKVLVEYSGYGEPAGRVYAQKYVCMQEYRDGKLIFYREYFDTLIVKESLGDLIAG